MNDQPERRRNLRLRHYDYTQAGAYFVTIVAQDRACLFGQIVDDRVLLNEAGQMIETQWLALPDRFPHMELDAFVVMPNHFHGILIAAMRSVDLIPCDSHPIPAPTPLGGVVGAFKSVTTWEYTRGVHARGWPRFRGKLWQRNYYEHVIRDEAELLRARQYIEGNPANWSTDDEKPS